MNDLNLKYILLIEMISLTALKSVVINLFTWLFKIFILFMKLIFVKSILLKRFKNLILFIFFQLRTSLGGLNSIVRFSFVNNASWFES